MPNLDYDPQNPTDLLGRPIKEGDIVAWGTSYGQSAAITVSEIVKIDFRRDKVGGRYDGTESCEQWQATSYNLKLLHIYGTNGTGSDFVHRVTGKPSWHTQDEFQKRPENFELRLPTKPNTVKLVQNVVKLNLTREEVIRHVTSL